MARAYHTEIVQDAINHYKTALKGGDAREIRAAISDMENTYIIVCCWSVPGSEELRQLILSARGEGGYNHAVK